MNRKMTTRVVAAIAVAASAALVLAGCGASLSGSKKPAGGASASAATWKPTKAVDLYVGYDPGGSGDPVARELALMLQNDWGVSVNVQNRSGASGAEATTEVLQAKPDGYSIAVAPASQLTVTPLISTDQLPFHSTKDWTSIAGLLDQQNGIMARPDSGWTDIKDFIKAAKAKPGQLTVGVPSVSGANAMAVASLEKVAGIKVKIVPFSGGSGESSVALLGGQIDAICATLSGQLGLLQAGKLVSLGHSGDKPYTAAKSTPLSKQGYPITGLANTVYYVYGPKKMPADVLAAYDAEIKKIQAGETYRTWLKTNSYNPHEVYGADAAKELDKAETDAKQGVQLLTDAGLNLTQKK
jgi:tripartite-type tricarboxylate transporter receptor subunit TctC